MRKGRSQNLVEALAAASAYFLISAVDIRQLPDRYTFGSFLNVLNRRLRGWKIQSRAQQEAFAPGSARAMA